MIKGVAVRRRGSSLKKVYEAQERTALAIEALTAQVAELIATNQDLIAILVDRYEEDHQDEVVPGDDAGVLD